ncbi:flagellar filament capping protein FliD [Sutcliffiella horikoshii]|uniref:Flagellar hook-associated protein 2 n=1 Tax=Sutcliffiella horikoshii TaxID=79883 RepID=A0A5D4T9F6_9BACI|nr:flagellar filament capping protein FliD [Sutcliffiella horikoshii]TYS72343.1 flagellar hook protein FliD [Sutcliffiella horikoshii]
MRLTGFQSGLDINQMVSDLMKAQRMPMNKLTQQKQLLEWKRDDYRETNRLLNDFRNLSFDMTLQRSYSQKLVTSSNDKVSASATSSAANVSYTLSDVTIATAATNSSSEPVMKVGEKLAVSTSLWEQRDKFGAFTNKTFPRTIVSAENSPVDSINIGKNVDKNTLPDIRIKPDADSPAELFKIVDTPVLDPTKNEAYYNEETGELVFSKPLPEGSIIRTFDYASSDFDFKITSYNQAGEEVQKVFEFNSTSTMNDIVSAINSSDLGVTAFYDEFNGGGLVLAKREAGAFNPTENDKQIKFEGAFLTNTLKLNQANETGGTLASVTINGVETKRNSNTFSINGVTFNLKENMTGESAVINVANDTDKTFNAVKEYLTKYNELIEKINAKTGEPVYRDYKPLSNEEKEALSEKQIEQWEEKARSGLLRNDSILNSGLGKMRSAMYETVSDLNGQFDQLAQLGVTTSINYRDKGKLVIDEDRLRAAIEKDPNSVMNLFTSNGEGDNGSAGIARKLRDAAEATIKGIEARAGNATRTAQQFTIGRELLNVDQRISAFERRMQTVEERYWRQFTAMEKAIGQSNQQSTQLMSQFFSG